MRHDGGWLGLQAWVGLQPWLGLERRCEWLHAKFAIQFRGVIGVTVLQYQRNIADAGYVLRRVPIDQYQVGALAAVDGTPVAQHTRIGRPVPRGDSQHLVGGYSRLDVQLQFPLKCEPLASVGARDDLNAGTVKTRDGLEHFCVGGAPSRRHLLRDLAFAFVQSAVQGNRQVIRDRGKRWIEFTGHLRELRFECGERRVEHRLACDEQLDQVLKWLRVEIQRIRVLGDERKSLQRTGIGIGLDIEVQQHLVDVLNFIVTVLDGILGLHEGRNMAAYPQAALMRIRRGVLHPFGLEGIVDLDLRIAALRVEIHRLPGTVEAVDQNTAAGVELALAFDEAGGYHVWPNGLVAIEAANRLCQGYIVIAHVAHGGNAGGKIQQIIPR